MAGDFAEDWAEDCAGVNLARTVVVLSETALNAASMRALGRVAAMAGRSIASCHIPATINAVKAPTMQLNCQIFKLSRTAPLRFPPSQLRP